jgi:pimeloyl-ACP methyl ester carboxylesterase
MMGERIDIGGHPTWVDDRGSGAETVLLLHGGMSNSDVMIDALGEPLLERYRVVAFDRRGHGYTADVGGPFHYDDMATDTIAVLEQVVGGTAHLVGWSDGGIIALLVAMRRPELVGRLVVIGANFHHDGVMPVDFGESTPLGDEMVAAYAARSPDGAEHFAELFERFLVMVTTEPTLTTADLATISAPTLVMAGDDDLVRLDHTCALYEALPAGQLSIVPGSSHALPVERPAEVVRIVLGFLAGDIPPSTFLPIRRAPG